MAKSNQYKEKNNPFLSVLYVLAVLALVAALAYMYKLNRDKRIAYRELVQQASLTDAGYDIESRKTDDLVVDLEDEPIEGNAVTLAPTVSVAPTPEVTEVPATEVPATEPPATEPPATEVPATEVPATEAPTAEPAPTATAFIESGADDLVDEALAQGISAN